MKKTKKKIGRNRSFNRIALFPNKPINENVAARQSLQKAFPCKFCQKSYLDSMIEEFDKLIGINESKVAIVDGDGRDLSRVYNLIASMRSFNS